MLGVFAFLLYLASSKVLDIYFETSLIVLYIPAFLVLYYSGVGLHMLCKELQPIARKVKSEMISSRAISFYHQNLLLGSQLHQPQLSANVSPINDSVTPEETAVINILPPFQSIDNPPPYEKCTRNVLPNGSSFYSLPTYESATTDESVRESSVEPLGSVVPVMNIIEGNAEDYNNNNSYQ
ncbi:uncharacterized protein [Parasteatoda tepidariorum]|uniref:uncharacterized protein n=1 Tax=Parasteatoda tepidariorum TaxID=114398 RepID=UPI00077FDD56|nr:uncharacterized protein LOC107442100 [Parasteatoda tepidariorum]